MGFKDGALAGGRDGGVKDGVRVDDGKAGLERGQIAVERDIDGVLGVRGEVVEVDASELLVYDTAGAGTCGLKVEALVLDDLLDLFGFRVVAEEGDGAVAIGEEVNLVADPERVRVVGIVARDLGEIERCQVDDPDRLGLAAVVALPRDLPLIEGRVGDQLAVGRDRSAVGGGKRKFDGKAGAVGVDAEELGEVVPCSAAAEEEDVLAVGRPAGDDVLIGVIREAMGYAAGRRHGIDVDVAVDARGVSEGLAVGREEGAVDDGSRGGEANGFATGSCHDPDVVGMAEGDLLLAEGGVEEEQRRGVHAS